jgi:flagellar biosynthesis/type III secretory pathway ATPase
MRVRRIDAMVATAWPHELGLFWMAGVGKRAVMQRLVRCCGLHCGPPAVI